MLAVAEWTLAYILWLMGVDLTAKLIWAKVEYVGIVSVPVAWLAFAVQYTGRQKWLTYRRLILLAVIPVVTLLLTWTNEFHGLVWAQYNLRPEGSMMLWERTYGAWFWVHAAYSYTLLLAGASLLIRAAFSSYHLYRRQAIVILIAVLVPTVGNAVYVFQVGSVTLIDFTPLAFAVSGFVIALGILRYKLMDIVPVARDVVIEGMNDGLMVLDAYGRVVDMNPAAQLIIGQVPSEVMGRPLAELLPNWPELAELRQTKDVVRLEIVLSRDGRDLHCDVRISPLYDRRGSVTGETVVLRDITDRKDMERQLEKVYQRERDLRQDLETEIKNRLEFTRALVHELRTPITPIMVCSEVLTTELREEPGLSLSKSIHRGVIHLDERIGELLDVARGEVGMLQLVPEQGDISKLLSEIVEDMETMASSQEKTLVSDLQSSLPPVWFDSARVRQVVMNLLDNAFKFTPEGGKITLSANEEPAALLVEVRDTGRGLSDEDKQKLFKPYQRLGGFRTHASGLGLGLALSKMLVELHGGEMRVESQEGKGSTFGFTLPLDSSSVRPLE